MKFTFVFTSALVAIAFAKPYPIGGDFEKPTKEPGYKHLPTIAPVPSDEAVQLSDHPVDASAHSDGSFASAHSDGSLASAHSDGLLASGHSDGPLASGHSDGPLASGHSDGPLASAHSDGPLDGGVTESLHEHVRISRQDTPVIEEVPVSTQLPMESTHLAVLEAGSHRQIRSSHTASSESNGEKSGFTYLPDHTISPSGDSLNDKVQRNIRTRRETIPTITTGEVTGPIVDPSQPAHPRTTEVVDEPVVQGETINAPVATVETGAVPA